MVGGTVGIYSSDQETKKRAVGGTGEERNPSRVFEKVRNASPIALAVRMYLHGRDMAIPGQGS